jgi:hypothetical protein
LDIYIKAARRLDLNDAKDINKARAIAGFFTKVINGDIPEPFKKFILQTYLVALEKDPNDKTKLRPLGVSSAIRRIASIVALREYTPVIVEHLLPHNYAIGVNGGVDVVIKSIQLAVDKYTPFPAEPWCPLTSPTCSMQFQENDYENLLQRNSPPLNLSQT